MRLSDLVKLAAGSDPEILVYEEDGERWRVLEVDTAGAVVSKHGLVVAGSRPGTPVLDWEDGEDANPFCQEGE